MTEGTRRNGMFNHGLTRMDTDLEPLEWTEAEGKRRAQGVSALIRDKRGENCRFWVHK